MSIISAATVGFRLSQVASSMLTLSAAPGDDATFQTLLGQLTSLMTDLRESDYNIMRQSGQASPPSRYSWPIQPEGRHDASDLFVWVEELWRSLIRVPQVQKTNQEWLNLRAQVSAKRLEWLGAGHTN